MSINEFREKKKHLPKFLKDFHDQKDFFKSMHSIYKSNENDPISPKLSFVDGQIYTIDWFLWFCALHGYGLRKLSSKDVQFKDINETISEFKSNQIDVLSKIINL